MPNTTDWLASLQAKRDEFYATSDSARSSGDWDTAAHYYSMAMGISAAVTAIFDAEVKLQRAENYRIKTS